MSEKEKPWETRITVNKEKPWETRITVNPGPLTCKEYNEFFSWLHKRLPYLLTPTLLTPSGSSLATSKRWLMAQASYHDKDWRVDGGFKGQLFIYEGQFFRVNDQPPDGATPADMDEATILISQEYVRRCKSMSSPHEKTPYCIHSLFQEAIEGVVGMAKVLRQGLVGERKALRKKLTEKDETETALRREVKALREKLAKEEAEAALRYRELKAARKNLAEKDKVNAALRKKLADKDEREEALRREVKALREKVERLQDARPANRVYDPPPRSSDPPYQPWRPTGPPPGAGEMVDLPGYRPPWP